MPFRQSTRPFLYRALVLLPILAAGWVVYTRLQSSPPVTGLDQTTSTPSTVATPNESADSTSIPPPHPARETLVMEALATATSTGELIDLLQSNLQENEEPTLQALRNMDLTAFGSRRIGDSLTDYFSGDPDVFGSLKTLETLKDSKAHFLYENVSADLLARHSKFTDPERVLTYLTNPKNEIIALKAIPGVGRQMIDGEADPQAILSAIIGIPEIANKESLVYGALDQWLSEDPAGLLAYISEQKHRPAHDQVIYNFVHRYQLRNPSAAMAWAEAINDPVQRFESVYSAAITLAQIEPEQFEQWMEQLAESELKNRIQEAVE